MFSNETLDYCTVIKIDNLMPKKLSMADANSVVKDLFLFIARDEGQLKAYMNLGFEPTNSEKEGLRNFLSSWGGSEHSEVHNTILEIEFPKFIIPFYERLNEIPGCRVDPNVFHSHGDVYVSVEYNRNITKQVNDSITDFLIRDHIFTKKLVYSGPQPHGLPYLLQLYAKNGNELGNFVVVKTVWKHELDHIRVQNQGVLQNMGNYVPKEFSGGNSEVLIFRTDSADIKGDVESKVVSPTDNLVEFRVKSNFFSDFSNEVIKRYSGPIFLQIVQSRDRQESYYVLEKELQIPFLKGLTEHWSRPARSNHVNYIELVNSLEEVVKLDGNAGRLGEEVF